MKIREIGAATVLVVLALAWAFWNLQHMPKDKRTVNPSKPRVELGPVMFMSDREPVKCEFEKPLKHVTLINHWYMDWDELNADYLALAEPNDEEHVWGWSNCIWQPDDDAAWCDIYAVVPLFVQADMYMDTLGHEVLHGSCGGFHN